MTEMDTGPAPAMKPFDDDEYEEQCQVASFWSASRLLLVGSIFLYGTFIFAYFYLRALNNHNNWRIGDQHPSTIIGTIVAVLVLGAALIHYVGARRLQIGARVDWMVGAMVALVMIVIAGGLQIWDLTRLPFQPASSAYAGLFIAWMPIYVIYIFGQFYWLETLLAQAVTRPSSVLQETPEGVVVVSRFGANVEGYVLFSQFMGLGAIVIWVLFYLIH